MTTLNWVLREARQFQPWLLLATWALGLVLSLFPALSVLAINSLAQQLSMGASGPRLWMMAALISVIIGAMAGLRQLYYSLGRSFAVGFAQHIATLFFAAISRRPTTNLSLAETAHSIRSAREAVTQTMAVSVVQAVENIALAVITSISLAWSLWSISPAASVISVVAIIPEMCVFMWVGKIEAKYWQPSSEHMRRATYLEDQLAYQKSQTELAILRGFDVFLSKSRQARSEYRRLKVLTEVTSAPAHLINTITTTALIMLCITVIIHDSGGNFGSVAAGIIGVSSGISAVRSVGYQVGELGQSLPATRVLHEFITHPVVAAPATTASAATTVASLNAITLRDVAVRYPGSEKWALAPLSLTLAPHRVYAVVGKNGAGKSTLLNAMMGRIDAEGTVSGVAEGREVAISPALFSVIDQEFGHFDISVREFLSLGSAEPVSDEVLWNALAHSDARELVAGLPDGLDTQLGAQWGGSNLSGGQWQKLALARMFVRDTPVWILDEPTSAIDAEAETTFFDSLARGRAGRITVVVSHRLSTLLKVDHVFVLSEGELVEEGSPKDLLRDATTVFARLFASQGRTT